MALRLGIVHIDGLVCQFERLFEIVRRRAVPLVHESVKSMIEREA